MIKAAIKKGSGIDVLVSGHSGQKVEEERTVEPVSSRLSDVIKIFNERYVDYLTGSRELFSTNLPILEPAEIDLVINKGMSFDYMERFYIMFPRLLNAVVQNSFNHGRNNFFLDLSNFSKLHYVASVNGRHSDPIKVSVKVNNANAVGNECCAAVIEVSGDKMASVGIASRDTLFKTRSRSILAVMRETVPSTLNQLEPSHNKIVFIHENGEEEVIKNYGYRLD